MTEAGKLIRIDEAAGKLGISAKTLEHWLEREGYKVPHLGRRRVRYVPEHVVDRLMKKRTAQQVCEPVV